MTSTQANAVAELLARQSMNRHESRALPSRDASMHEILDSMFAAGRVLAATGRHYRYRDCDSTDLHIAFLAGFRNGEIPAELSF